MRYARSTLSVKLTRVCSPFACSCLLSKKPRRRSRRWLETDEFHAAVESCKFGDLAVAAASFLGTHLVKQNKTF